MSAVVYCLCALTALVCSLLLFRGYAQNRSSLLLWSALCFAGLTVSNSMVFVDLYLVPDTDLLRYRNISAFVAFSLLIYGLIWETK